MDIIELFIDETDEAAGIEAISVVENPAIESDFVALKNKEFKLAEVDKEKRILMGAALIPNKPIYRQSGEQEYYIYFSKNTVRKASELFFINGNQNNSTLEHELELKGLTAVESWIVESEQDKSRMYDLNVPIGTWMVSMKVNNDDVWKKVKAGEVKGFSIEGYFADKLERPNEPVKDEMKEPCYDGYEMIGFKMKNGKKVPNCVPIKQSKMSKEEIAKAKIEELKQLFSIEKVELGIMQDLQKAINKHISQKKKIDNNISKWYGDLFGIRDKFVKLESDFKEFNSSTDDLKKYVKEAENMAKQLGVNSSAVEGYQEAKAYINTSEDIVQEYKEAKKLESKIG
tara:strand:+ start:1454 stop:2482 length:1029 start_codon:yes stop_codon:yes gene_type:complete